MILCESGVSDDELMRLQVLEPQFLRRVDARSRVVVFSIFDADGVQFLCPVCYQKNGGRVGTHSIVCWAPHVPQDTHPTPGRWRLVGTGLRDLTLVAGSSSVRLLGDGGCAAHFYVRNGGIVLA